MSRISAVINTFNEEKNIKRCIDSLKNFADEIVVVDMQSIDKTKEIAKSMGAKVFDCDYVGYVEPARNFAIKKAKNDWILILDADEELLPSLKLILKDRVDKSNYNYFRIPRKNIIFGKWIKHTLWWPDYQIRFFKKGSVNWSDDIHSLPIILHHNYDFLEQFVERLNRYSTVQAKLLSQKKYKFVWTDLIEKPFKEFISRFFTGEGYKDGVHGLLLSMLQTFSELVVYAKIWQIQKFDEKDMRLDDLNTLMSSKVRDLRFWQNDMLYKTTGKFLYKIKRKLKI